MLGKVDHLTMATSAGLREMSNMLGLGFNQTISMID